MADLDAALEVRRLRAQDLRAGRNDLPSDAYAAEHVVCRRLAGHLQRNGAYAQNVHDLLGLGSYETAWAWLHKLRRAMVRPDGEQLSGVVEVVRRRRVAGNDGASTDKVPVMIAVEDLETQVNRKPLLGRVRLRMADVPGSLQRVDFAGTVAAPGSLIRTDGARMFRVLAEEGFAREYVAGSKSPEPGYAALPGPRRVAALLERWIAGTHHYRVEREHLPYYLDEFTFRFNRAGRRLAGCCSTGCCSRA